VRAKSEILAIWAALKKLVEVKNDAICVVLLRLLKTKFQHAAFLLSTLAHHLTELSKVFQVGCFNFSHMKASAELLINKLSDAGAKSELKPNCAKFESEFEELRTPDGCTSSGMAFWKGTERSAN